MTLLFVSYIWIWNRAFPGHFWVFFTLYVSLGASGHWRRGESLADIGFTLRNFGSAARLTLVFVGPLLLVPPLVGAWIGEMPGPDLPIDPRRVLFMLAWGTAQQYGLLAFFYRRFVEVLPGRSWPILAAAGIFALFHLPNPFLTPVTLVAGVIAAWIYSRAPNLWVLGAAHAALSTSISWSLPEWVTFGMRVGPGCLRFIESLLRTGTAT